MPEEAAAAAVAEVKPASNEAVEAVIKDASTKTVDPPKGLGVEAGKEPAASDAPVPKSWYADDWREKIAGDDPKKLQRLARYASLENYVNRTTKLESDLHAGRLKPQLSEGASETEIADYRKAWGIPAEATDETYGVKWPEGYTPTAADKADLAEYIQKSHARNKTPAEVQENWNDLLVFQARAAEQLQMAAQMQTEESKAEVRGQYMGENGRFDRMRFERDGRIGNQHLNEILGEDDAQKYTSLTLADGTKLGDHPLCWRLNVGAGLKMADDLSLVTAETGGGTAGTLDEQLQALIKIGDTDPKKYHSAEIQAKVDRVSAAIAQRDSRRAA